VTGRRDERPVLAAGAVLRRGDGLIAVVHRPRYNDWTLPKGKLEAGEDDERAALREVLEETGHRAAIAGELGETHYRVTRRGVDRPKRVRYYVMDVLGGGFAPHAEVDDLRWLTVQEARRLLTYERDREVLDRFFSQFAANGLDGRRGMS
jgi:8-oxo-dGTP pyrophosphatase MutT (NUDIX family)